MEKIEDEHKARQVRNESAKEIKNARLQCLKKKLENLDKNSPDSWAAIGEYLGWRKSVSPTMLIQDGQVLTKGQELAEAKLKQYSRKEDEVNQALGEAEGDYLKLGRNLTKGNTGVFKFSKITTTKKGFNSKFRRLRIMSHFAMIGSHMATSRR